MTDATEARKNALRQFLQDHGGFARVVENFGLTQSHASYLSQLTAQDSIASFGERSAKNWEERLKIEDGKLVNAGRPAPINVHLEDKTSGHLQNKETEPQNDFVIHQFEDIGGGMGNGFNLTDHPPGHIKSWRVDHDWLRLNVPSHSGVRNLCIVTGFGPSMKPMFNPGDPLLVDTGVKVIDHEGVYFFRVGDEGYIKLIQRVPEFEGPGVILRVISKNPDYPPYDLSPKNPHFQVLGKVLTVWRSEQF